jgi:Tol biopolymer transport system component
MNGITHKQAKTFIQADLDGLLADTQRRDLDAHLRECEACRVESESLSMLTVRLSSNFQARWNTQDGPSKNVMASVLSQKGRIIMSNRIRFGLRALAGIGALIVLGFLINFAFSELRNTSVAVSRTEVTSSVLPAKQLPLIAFVSEKSGNPEIYTMRADGSNVTQLTKGPAQNYGPAWSPDGKRIAFINEINGETNVSIMNADGSAQIPLIKTSYSFSDFAWSPDGRRIAVSGTVGNKPGLYVIDVDGNRAATLLDGDGEIIIGQGPPPSFGWSPDSKQIVYVKAVSPSDPDNITIYVVNVDGSGKQELFQHYGVFQLIGWQDAQHFYGSIRNQDLWELFRFSTTGTPPEKIESGQNNFNPSIMFKSKNNLIYVTEYGSSWTWNHIDGAKIIFLSTSSNYATQCQKPPIQDITGGVESSLLPSRDGQYALVDVICGDGNTAFSIVSNDGTSIKPLFDAPLPTRLLEAHWSPDGQYILINLGYSQSGKGDFFLIDLEKTLQNPTIRPTPLTTDKASTDADWQPLLKNTIFEERPTPEPTQTSSNGGLIAFVSDQNGNMDIYTMRMDGSDVTNLTNNPANDTSPTWSPDGKKIAFISDRTGNPDIFEMNSDGSNLIQLTDNPGDDIFSTWSPNGQKIIYSVSAGNDPNTNSYQLFVVNADGSNKTALTNELGSCSFLGWSPDGQKIIYMKQSTDPRDMMENTIVYSVKIDGTDRHELFKGGDIESIRWNDDNNFTGIAFTNNGPEGNAYWYLYRFNIAGTPPVKLGSSSVPIDAWYTDATTTIYITKSYVLWYWHDEHKKFSDWTKWNYAADCKSYTPVDLYLNDANHSESPEGKQLFISVNCDEGVSWFYLVSADGSQIRTLADMSLPTHWRAMEANWSPDGKYVLVAFEDGNGNADFYLFDIAKMLNDPATKPIQLTTDGAMKYGAAWQPQP